MACANEHNSIPSTPNQSLTPMSDYTGYSYGSMDFDGAELCPVLLETDNNERENAIDVGQLYQSLYDNNIDVCKRLELFTNLKMQLQMGNILPTRIAAYHIQFCTEMMSNFNTQCGIGKLEGEMKLLILALELLQELFMMGDNVFTVLTLKSPLLSNLAKLVSMFAESSDLVTKDLVKLCSVDQVLGCGKKVPPHETLRRVIDVPNLPDVFLTTNVCQTVVMQHKYDCVCTECKENPDKPPVPSNPYTLKSGENGTDVFPLRHITQCKAAICVLPQYWLFIESRSKKISEDIANLLNHKNYLRQKRIQSNHIFGPGQQVAVVVESLDWMDYDPLTTNAPPLPPYMRGFVVGERNTVLTQNYIGVWLPDFALCVVCAADKLIPLPAFSSVRTLAPLIYIASVSPPPALEVVSIAISLMYEMLQKNSKRDDVKILLEDKGTWKTVQLIKFLDSGDTKTKLLAIVNMLIESERDDRACRGLFTSCLHNILADWLVWKVFTQRIPEMEQMTVIQGLIYLIPRIEVRKWTRRFLVLQALYFLMRSEPSVNVMNLLIRCKDLLAWNQNKMGQRSNRHFQPRRTEERQLWQYDQSDYHSKAKERDVSQQNSCYNCEHRFQRDESLDDNGKHTQYNIGRKPRSGETWYICTKNTYSMVVSPPAYSVSCVDLIRSTVGTMVRGLLYKSAKQGMDCEVMQVKNIQDVRHPLLARLICGLLNSGGGRIFIGLGAESHVQGIHAPRPERDSFTQGVLDVVTYNLEPRLLPYTFQLQQRAVLRFQEHLQDGDWNRFVFILHLRPPPGVTYQVLPEKQSFIRRPPEGTTVCSSVADKLENEIK